MTAKQGKIVQWLGLLLLTYPVLALFIGMWWWALFGMSEPIGWAYLVTGGAAGLLGWVAWGIGGEARRQGSSA